MDLITVTLHNTQDQMHPYWLHLAEQETELGAVTSLVRSSRTRGSPEPGPRRVCAGSKAFPDNSHPLSSTMSAYINQRVKLKGGGGGTFLLSQLLRKLKEETLLTLGVQGQPG